MNIIAELQLWFEINLNIHYWNQNQNVKMSDSIHKTIEGEKKKRKKANIICFGSKEKEKSSSNTTIT